MCRLASAAGTCSLDAAPSPLEARFDAVFEVLATSVLGAGAADAVLSDLTSLAISRGAVTLVMVAADTDGVDGTSGWMAGLVGKVGAAQLE
jgi:hypothetical protein